MRNPNARLKPQHYYQIITNTEQRTEKSSRRYQARQPNPQNYSKKTQKQKRKIINTNTHQLPHEFSKLTCKSNHNMSHNTKDEMQTHSGRRDFEDGRAWGGGGGGNCGRKSHDRSSRRRCKNCSRRHRCNPTAIPAQQLRARNRKTDKQTITTTTTIAIGFSSSSSSWPPASNAVDKIPHRRMNGN